MGNTQNTFRSHLVNMVSCNYRTFLKSKRAVEVSIKIIDVLVQLRPLVLSNGEIKLELEKIKKKVDNQDKNIEIIFKYFDELLYQKAQLRKEIGYKISKEK